MTTHVVCDPYEENLAEPDFLQVRDEVTFLKCVNSAGMLFIQGQSLCAWATQRCPSERMEC